MRAVAFFDLDKTIIAKSSVLAFAGPLFEAKLLTRRDVTRSAYAQFTFAAGRADHDMMERMRTYLSAMVVGWDTEALRVVIDRHLARVVAPLIYAEAVELIEEHRRAGRPVIMVTSTGADMAEPIGAMLGVDTVLSTQMVERDGRYTGEISDYMYAERKAEAVRDLADREGYDLTASYGYSDSTTDLPLLSAVGYPHAVNPDRELRRVALAKGWPVLQFRRLPGTEQAHRRQKLIMVGAAVLGTGLGVGLAVLRHARSTRHAERAASQDFLCLQVFPSRSARSTNRAKESLTRRF